MIIGYCRVSTLDQDLEPQQRMLEQYGCEKIFFEKISSIKHRPELDKALSYIREDDFFVVVRLDRLGRSLKDLISLSETIKNKGAHLISLNDCIDTSTASGRFFFNVVASLSQFERELISERTKTGLEARKRRGIKVGRKPGISGKMEQTAIVAEDFHRNNEISVVSICEKLNISKPTLYKLLRSRGWNPTTGWIKK